MEAEAELEVQEGAKTGSLHGVNSTRRPFDARDFFNNKMFSDISIEFSDDAAGTSATFHAHRMVLHGSSEYFQKAIEWSARTGQAPGEKCHLKIDSVSPDVGGAILGFLYGKELEVSSAQLLPWLVTVDRLQLSELQEVAQENLRAKLSAETALALAEGIAEHCPGFAEAWMPLCAQFIAQHEAALASSKALGDVSHARMMAMVSATPPIFLSPISATSLWLARRAAGAATSDPSAAGGESPGEGDGEEEEDEGLGDALSSTVVDLFGARGKKESGERQRALANAALAFESFYLLAQDARVGYECARKHMEDFLTERLSATSAMAFVSAAHAFKHHAHTKALNAQFDWHERVCMRYVRRNTKVVLESGGLFMLDETLVRALLEENELAVSEEDLFRAVLHWGSRRSSDAGAVSTDKTGVKKFLKGAGVMDQVRFPIMSPTFFHQAVEKAGVVPSRLLLEWYQYHHVGSLLYSQANVRLHHRLPLVRGAGCFACRDPSHGPGCERWVVRCEGVEVAGAAGAGPTIFRAADFRTCGGDLWGVSVFPPGTDEKDLRGGHGMGLGRGMSLSRNISSDNSRDGTLLAPNEWAVNLRRLSQDTGTTLVAASTGLSRRFDAPNQPFWDLCTQTGLNVCAPSPYTYTNSAWVIWRRTHTEGLDPLSDFYPVARPPPQRSEPSALEELARPWMLSEAAGGLGEGGVAGVDRGGAAEHLYAEIHLQSFSPTAAGSPHSGFAANAQPFI